MIFNCSSSFIRKMAIVSQKGLWIFIGIAVCLLLYEIFSTDGSDKMQKLNKRSIEEIKKDIASELRSILILPENDKPKREIDEAAIIEHRRHLLANPDTNRHKIKPPTDVVFNKTALNKYIDILLHKEAPATVLQLTKRSMAQNPSAQAPIFMQDLPYRWNIGEFLLTPWKVEKRFTSKPPLKHECFRPPQTSWSLIALVKSWVVNKNIRDAIRETWGKINSLGGVEVHVVFLLAKAAANPLQEQINEENNKYGDILQIDAAEQIKFFTVRTVSGMAWVSQHFPSDFLYASLDDNMVPALHNLIPLIDPFVKQAPILTNDECLAEFVFPFLCGYSLRIHDKPPRNSKSPWSMSEQLYPPKILPPHCQGGFYATSVSTVNLLVDTATKTYPSHFDAVWITGILRQKLGLNAGSIKDLTKMKTNLVHYLEYDIAQSIRKKWAMDEGLLKNIKILFRPMEHKKI